MAKLSRADLKLFFETGDFPTQAQFADLIDSCMNLVDDTVLDSVRQIVFDSSVENVVIKDAATGIQIEFDTFGTNDVSITPDGGAFLKGNLFINDNFASLAFGPGGGNIAGIQAGNKFVITQLDNTNIFRAEPLELGFYNNVAVVQPTITGSRGGNVALADLLNELDTQGILIDNTTA